MLNFLAIFPQFSMKFIYIPILWLQELNSLKLIRTLYVPLYACKAYGKFNLQQSCTKCINSFNFTRANYVIIITIAINKLKMNSVTVLN